MENIDKTKSKEERIKIIRRAYKLLTETSLTELPNDKLRRTRLLLPKPCTIDGVLKEHSRVLTNIRVERLRKLLNITNTIPQPHYLTFKCYYKRRRKRKKRRQDENEEEVDESDEESLFSNDDNSSYDRNKENQLVDNFNRNEEDVKDVDDAFDEDPLTRAERKRRKNLSTKLTTELPTIKEEITYDQCDLSFYIDLVCNCMDALVPTKTIDNDLREYRKLYAKNL